VSVIHERALAPPYLSPGRARSGRSTRAALAQHRLPSPVTVTAAATLFLAPVEGYLQQFGGATAGKVMPGVFLLTWALSRVWLRRSLGRAHLVVAAIGGLTICVVVATLANPLNDDGMVYLSRWLPFLVLTVALIDVVSVDMSPAVALGAVTAGAVAAGAGALFSFAVLGDARATGPMTDPNDLAYVLSAAVPIVLVRLGVARGRAALVAVSALAVLLAGAAVTVSRGGVMAIAAVLAWVTLRRLVPTRLLLAGAGVVAVIGLAGLLLVGSQVSTALDQKSNIALTNVETRTLRWQAALRMLADHPLTGVGPGGFRHNYVRYSDVAELDEFTPVTHEMYLEVAAETGVPGLAFFVGTILAAAVSAEIAVRRLRAARVSPGDPLLLAAYGAQGSLLAICISSSFLSEEYYMPLWAAIAVSAAVELRTRPLVRYGLQARRQAP
jgi:putative inorganic carbon (hco3(-)) transporter